MRARPDLNQGSADLQSATLTTELCTRTSIVILTISCVSNCTYDTLFTVLYTAYYILVIPSKTPLTICCIICTYTTEYIVSRI